MAFCLRMEAVKAPGSAGLIRTHSVVPAGASPNRRMQRSTLLMHKLEQSYGRVGTRLRRGVIPGDWRLRMADCMSELTTVLYTVLVLRIKMNCREIEKRTESFREPKPIEFMIVPQENSSLRPTRVGIPYNLSIPHLGQNKPIRYGPFWLFPFEHLRFAPVFRRNPLQAGTGTGRKATIQLIE